MRYLLDTNICIALLQKKEEKIIKKLKENSPGNFALCSVVKAELLYGARKSQKVDENLALLQEFFRQFISFPFDDRASEYYGVMRAILVKAGTPIGANDLLIASIAQVHQLIVVTRNRSEFQRVPGLAMEEW